MALSSDEGAEYLRLLEAERLDNARESLDAFCRYIDIPGAPMSDDRSAGRDDCERFYADTVTPAEHHQLINSVLERVERREIKRAMFFMPPGSAKSTYASVVFPSWFMGRNPGQNIISTSYGTTLARKFGRKCRQITGSAKYARLFGTELKKDNRSAEDWSLTNEAQYMAGGILSGITGNRADGLIIDDPVKGHEQADSPTIRDKTWDAYLTDLRTRLKPRGFIIIIQTRWHESDLSGLILPETYDGESGFVEARDGEPWYVVCLQACAERTDDPLGRAPGQWLWTDWFSEAHWERERRIQGARNWAALYQQRPKPAEGALIQRAWIHRYNPLPAGGRLTDGRPTEFLRVIQSWDTAYKDTEINDPSVCTTWGETRQGWYLLDVFRDRMEYPALKRAVASLAEQWSPHAILIEDKSSGQSLIQEMRGHFAQPVIALTPEGSKLDRLVSVSSLYEAGLVHHPEHGAWLMDYESELFGYPLTTHDDQVDSTSQALNWMFSNRGSYRVISAGDTRAALAEGDHDTRRPGGFGSIRGGNSFGGFF